MFKFPATVQSTREFLQKSYTANAENPASDSTLKTEFEVLQSRKKYYFKILILFLV